MINIQNLNKTYDKFQLNISLDIPSGIVSGIVGRNGAGKSTLIKAVLGLIKADSGSIKTFNKDPLLLNNEDKQLIGVALADSGFSTYLCINDICKILRKMYKSFNETEFIRRCEEGGLPLNKRLSEFSTGMRAKLKVLIAITHEPKLLILDEPTAGLDVVARNEVLDMLRNYLAQDNERTLLISSHISSDLESICDDIYMIDQGQIILHEDTDKILDEYAILKITRRRFEEIDKQYIIKTKEEDFGFSCLTNQKQYYCDNYPDIIIESGNIDDMIMIMSEVK